MKKNLIMILSICFVCCSCNKTDVIKECLHDESTFYLDIVKFKDPKLAAYIPAGIVTDENGEKRYIIELFYSTPEHFPEYYNELKQGCISYKLHNDYCIVKYSNQAIVQTKFLWSDLDELCSKMFSFETYTDPTTIGKYGGDTYFCLPPEYIESDENIFAERHRINSFEFAKLLESNDILYNKHHIFGGFPFYSNNNPKTYGTSPQLFPDTKNKTVCWNEKHPYDNSNPVWRTIDEYREDCINCFNEIIDNNDFERYDYYLKDQIR